MKHHGSINGKLIEKSIKTDTIAGYESLLEKSHCGKTSGVRS